MDVSVEGGDSKETTVNVVSIKENRVRAVAGGRFPESWSDKSIDLPVS